MLFTHFTTTFDTTTFRKRSPPASCLQTSLACQQLAQASARARVARLASYLVQEQKTPSTGAKET